MRREDENYERKKTALANERDCKKGVEKKLLQIAKS